MIPEIHYHTKDSLKDELLKAKNLNKNDITKIGLSLIVSLLIIAMLVG